MGGEPADGRAWGRNPALKAVVETLNRNAPDIDLVARPGGDEFALLLPGTDLAAAQLVIARLQEQLRGTMADIEWPVTFSIGAVTFAALPITTAEMLRRADELMYSAKNGGKDLAQFQLAS